MDDSKSEQSARWTDMDDLDKVVRFCIALERVLQEMDRVFIPNWREGIVHVSLNGQPVGLGLTNIANRCDLIAEDQWPEVIKEHILDVLAAAEELNESINEDEARNLVSLRIFGPEVTIQNEVLSFVLSDRFQAIMGLERFNTFKYLTIHDLERWGWSQEDAWSIGYENLAKNHPLPQPWEQGPLLVFEGDLYTASHILRLPESEYKGINGLIAGAPTQNRLLVLPIQEYLTHSDFQHLIEANLKLSANQPHQVTRDLVWFDGKNHHAIGLFQEAQQKVRVEIPVDLRMLIVQE